MTLQKQFEKFNENIKMDYDENSELASKRDILVNKLKSNEDLPSFTTINQGSYSMYTGVKPLDNKDYDIDVGLRFNVNKGDYKPLELKEKVYEILKDHTDYGAEIKQPCVTVTYKKNGNIGYHVDLVIYSYEDKDDTNSQMYLARGKEYSEEKNKKWEKADPMGLKDEIMNKYEDADERAQYRRIIRYLKRWKNIKFNSEGNSEPPGIGITLLAYEKFQPKYETDNVTLSRTYNDLEALTYLVQQIKGMFLCETYENGRLLYRIKLNLPVTPKTDVFCKMTDIQMTDFKNKIEDLLSDLEKVKNEVEVVEQCKKLKDIFGDDFEVPEKKDTAKKQACVFAPNSSSGGR
ncbi:nucleotidyltransferase domain-containing protein [Clostridium paraputrificum]|uniref:nucleotidyltransferase domain-containing protein n=1 Tax=Clostridium paraputrificum TaxID=29363 RepID=UPI00189CC54D|nr:nucleotidyltransferase [Clostridium paraputrificum]